MTQKNDNQRVVITAMGIISPIAHDIDGFWNALMTGKSGSAPTTIFDASTFPTTFSAEVKDYDLTKYLTNLAPHKNANRAAGFVLGAAQQACKQARIDTETDSPTDKIDRTRLGVYLGSGEGSVDNDVFFNAIAQSWDNDNRQMNWDTWAKFSLEKMNPTFELEQEPSMATAHLATLVGARGPTRSCLTACAASTQALGEAAMIIRNGEADIMISGGAHSMIHPLGLTGFNRLTALSTRNDSPETASRPFSATRDGFVLGEGAAVLVLESLASAKKRNVPVLAEIIGYGCSSDAFRVTDMHDQGRGGVQAIQAALKDAGITPDKIDWINTHGTSTTENDAVETKAIKTVFAERAKQVPASSIKGMMGHLIGATGAAELISCVLAIHNGIIPPTANLHDPDPALDLDYVPNEPRKADLKYVINESFGFGGQNNVVVIKRFTD